MSVSVVAVVESSAAAAAAAAAEAAADSMAGPAAGKAQIGKTAQRMMVRLGLLKWGLGTRNRQYHRRRTLVAPPKRPVHDRDRDARTPCHGLGVGVGQRQLVETRSNEDA